MNKIPVITIDGPSGSGKGTVGRQIAQKLGWHFLDSGAIYRLLALYLKKQNNPSLFELENSSSIEEISSLSKDMPAAFEGDKIILDGKDVTGEIRHPSVGQLASKVAVIPAIREALLKRQQDFRMEPGLVADGRDMGTVVFKDADLKIFLDASVEERANRRYHQLIKLGENVNLGELVEEVAKRDARDRNRAVAPLKPAEDAIIIDSTDLSISEVVDKIYTSWQNLANKS